MKILTPLFLTITMVIALGMSSIASSDNYALQFDGQDDYVACDTEEVKNLPEGNLPRTEETWLKTTEVPTGLVTLMGYGNNSGNQMLNILLGDGQVVISQWGDAVFVDAPVTDGQWHHVAVVHDGANTQTIYVDGEAKEPTGAWSLDTVATYCKIGCRIDTAVEFFPGVIDETRIWSVARTAAEINDGMLISLAGNEPGLVGYWQFDEGSGTTVADATGNNNGEFVNDPEWVASDIPGFVTTAVSRLNKLAVTWGNVKSK
jgi:hypothetical protein